MVVCQFPDTYDQGCPQGLSKEDDMRFSITPPPRGTLMRAAYMKPGQLGTMVVDHTQHTVMRIYRRVVSLHDPEQTWLVDGLSYEVELLPPGTIVQLTQE
jgi:hypothetical protein